MFLARVEGSVVATKKDDGLSGRKLLLVRPQLVDESDPAKFRPGKNTIVAVDSVGAGEGELVMFTQGSSARLAPNMKSAPVDAVVVGAGTVAADDPQLTVRHAEGSNPVRVVLDPRARVSGACKVFRDGAAPTLHLMGHPHAAIGAAAREARMVRRAIMRNSKAALPLRTSRIRRSWHLPSSCERSGLR